MASTRRKSAAIALAVIGVAGLSLAAAATLTVNSSQLAAGSIAVTGCDTAVSVDYTVVGMNVTAVNLSNINAACNGADYSIQLTTGTGTDAGAALGVAAVSTATITLAVTGSDDLGTATVTLPASQPAASVTGIAIVLY